MVVRPLPLWDEPVWRYTLWWRPACRSTQPPPPTLPPLSDGQGSAATVTQSPVRHTYITASCSIQFHHTESFSNLIYTKHNVNPGRNILAKLQLPQSGNFRDGYRGHKYTVEGWQTMTTHLTSSQVSKIFLHKLYIIYLSYLTLCLSSFFFNPMWKRDCFQLLRQKHQPKHTPTSLTANPVRRSTAEAVHGCCNLSAI